MNLGDTFSRLTNYRLKSTKHRVVDIGGERFSVPFFMEPKYLAEIPQKIVGIEKDEEVKTIVYGDWCKERLTIYGEWKNHKIRERGLYAQGY